MSVFGYDRQLGEAIRARVERVPGGPNFARVVAGAVSPVFHLAVGASLAAPGHRAAGARMLAGGAAAAIAARVLRDGIGRPRPGDRTEGGLPSRHAAAATAISLVALRRRPLLGLGLSVFGVVGLLARVGSGQHDPADIVAGCLVGGLAAYVVRLPLAPVRFLLRELGLR